MQQKKKNKRKNKNEKKIFFIVAIASFLKSKL